MINPILSADTTTEIAANFAANIVDNSVLCSDGSWAYVAIAKEKNCDHKRLINNKRTNNALIAQFIYKNQGNKG